MWQSAHGEADPAADNEGDPVGPHVEWHREGGDGDDGDGAGYGGGYEAAEEGAAGAAGGAGGDGAGSPFCTLRSVFFSPPPRTRLPKPLLLTCSPRGCKNGWVQAGSSRRTTRRWRTTSCWRWSRRATTRPYHTQYHVPDFLPSALEPLSEAPECG